ncbi:MAG: hypothetical protein FJ261_04325 [Planctomycetes bacterium]|nr:hypothetical protein [Planctomycetota bacterium]
MVDAIRGAHTDIQVEAHTGSGGVFDVVADGRKIFSKWDAGRFPSNAEILKTLGEMRAQKA